MMEIKRWFALLLCGALLLTGCSQTEVTNDDKANSAKQDSTKQTASATIERQQNENTSQDDNGNSADASPAPTTAMLKPKKEYSDTRRTVSILGLQEYKKLETNAYTDKAAKGKVFLVLFLEIYNKGIKKEYFNVNYLTANVNGKELENTFLTNEPEGYPTIFANIEPEKTAEGFIVWEVPKDWKTLQIDYHGWRDSDGISLTCNLTKKDLRKPEKYEA